VAHKDDLLKAFHIGPEDLDANHAGKLGTRQAARLIRSGRNDVLAALVVGALLSAILYGVAAKPLKPVQWVLAGVLFLAALATGILHARRTRAAAADGRVECLAGPVGVESRGQQGWWLTVAGREFRLPVRPWNVKNERAYRVYVAPRVNLIVGMEPEGWE
jgi:hypothetical protein